MTAPTERDARNRLRRRFDRVRGVTERLVAPLTADDYRVQSMPDVSPPYWNLGHTSWFFAANVLQPRGRMPGGFDGMDFALNSYYEGLGPRLSRERRGAVAAPTTDAVRAYRRAVDDAMRALFDDCRDDELPELQQLVAIGCEHEQQHQELFVTEILHIRWSSPAALRRGYLTAERRPARGAVPGPLRAIPFLAADTVLGHEGPGLDAGGFCWDNELPPHRVHVGAFALADRLVTNAEWLAFVADGGYENPLLWLANGWDAVRREGCEAPLYWQRDGAGWLRFSLAGLAELDPHAPVAHVSFYEADAFARWYGEQHGAWRHARLPRECEWERAAKATGFDTARANLLDDELDGCAFDVTPVDPTGPADRAAGPVRQLAGTAWEWTQSHYEPYPGYRPFAGALMEYNGKFMDNQRVLRGGSFATPPQHVRASYRNFWHPGTRFQFTGARVARDA